MASEPHHAVVDYPGGLRGRYRWAGSGEADAVFALSEVGGSLEDLGALVSSDPDRLCRAELRLEHPAGAWTVRLASPIYDEPTGLAWDTAGLLLVRYGFVTYAFGARTGALAWHHRSGSPIVALIGSSRLDHAIVQAEVETFAIGPDGEVVWRAAHSDVVAEAALVGGRLVLTSFGGSVSALDPATGRMAG
jgi:hypothetical protein